MAFDTELAERIRAVVCHFGHWDEKKMFGGLCIMLNGHMLCGVLGDELMVCQLDSGVCQLVPRVCQLSSRVCQLSSRVCQLAPEAGKACVSNDFA